LNSIFRNAIKLKHLLQDTLDLSEITKSIMSKAKKDEKEFLSKLFQTQMFVTLFEDRIKLIKDQRESLSPSPKMNTDEE